MKPYLFLLLTLISGFTMLAQSTSESTEKQQSYSGLDSSLMQIKTVEEAKELALEHVNLSRPALLIRGGIAPTIIKNRNAFQNRYGVYYHEFGCLGPSTTILKAYNSVVFAYLDKQHGQQWREAVHPDTAGLDKPSE